MPPSHPSRRPRSASRSIESNAGARYHAFIEQDAVGIAEVETSGRFRLVNRKFCELTGYSEPELLERRFQDITHPQDLPQNIVNLQRLLREGIPYGFEKRYLRKDGSEVWVYVSATRIDPEPGAAPSILATVLDMSERRRAEAAARATDENYKTLFNSIDAGFCVIEILFDSAQQPIDYVFHETNAAFERLTGLSNAQGTRMRERVPDHEQHWFDTYGRVAVSGEAIRFEQEARALHRWYSVYAFRNGAAGTNRVGVLFEDISARKTSEQRRLFLAELSDKLAALRDEKAIVRAAVEAVGRFLQVDRCYFVECLETENRVVVGPNHVREGTASLEGELSLFDFGGMEWWRSYAGGGFAVDDVSRHHMTRQRAARYAAIGVGAYLTEPYKREGPWTVVLALTEKTPRIWTPDESKLVEDAVARVWPLVERARSEHALMLAHRVLEQRVTERTATLQETISELESYSYSISHDLRAPLRAMQSYASILSEESADRLDAPGKEYLRRIMAAAERMDRLIRDVLVFSRVARGNMPMERVELGSFMAGIIESYPGLSVTEAEIELVSPLGAVRANPAALTQCLSNLLGNAIKFAPPGDKPRIRIWAEAGGKRRRLFVRDNGIGIPADAHEKIFNMFYQLDQTREGTGIGLAVVRKALERMGGSIGVISAPGRGSTFWLELEDADERVIL